MAERIVKMTESCGVGRCRVDSIKAWLGPGVWGQRRHVGHARLRLARASARIGQGHVGIGRARPGLIGDQLAGPGDGAIDSSP
jgi:hypothetical protein